ncbi:MAG: aldo/keto reductase [Desulfobacteraceae bacterium]|nr:aldo/keto reductase [Desulfobacteraceae bacterium]
MKNNSINRRDFIKKCFTTTAVLSAVSYKDLFSEKKGEPFDAKDLPTRVLGKTGFRVPLIGIGGGSRFCTIKNPEKSIELLNYALNHGFYYWDTAHDYAYENVISEERYGLVLKSRRDEVFLATKVMNRTYDGALRHVEESLKRLKTDHVEIYQIHNIQSIEDVEKIGAKDGVLKALQKLKEEKVTRFIGYSGHLSAEAMTEMANRYDFDTMIIALNHYEERQGDFEKQAIPAAAKKKMGILAMKVIRPRETVTTITPEELIRYALSLKHVNAAVIGIDGMDVLKKNIELVRNFKPMTSKEMMETRATLDPFFESKSLAWMQPGYTDGHLA